jgi:hypothetical protein
MVTMFMRHQQRGNIRRMAPQTRHAAFCFTTGKAAVDHHQRGPVFNQGGVPATAAAE